MRRIRRTLLLTLGAVAAVALAATPALAQTAQIEEHGEEYGGGAFTLELVSDTVAFETGVGEISCNESGGSGMIDEPMIDGQTVVGSIDDLFFAQNGNHLCPTTIFGISNCEIEAQDLPWDLSVEPVGGSYALQVADVEMILHCNSVVGSIDCAYQTAALQTLVGEGHEVTTVNQHFELESGSLLCWEEVILEAEYELEDDASGEHLTIKA